MKIFIDPNHGHCDVGSNGYRNYYDEAETLFELALLVKTLLESQHGYECMLSRGLEKKSTYLSYKMRGQRASEFCADFVLTLDYKYIIKKTHEPPKTYASVYCNDTLETHKKFYQEFKKHAPKELGEVQISHFSMSHNTNELAYEYRGAKHKFIMISLGVFNHKAVCEYAVSPEGKKNVANAISTAVFNTFG